MPDPDRPRTSARGKHVRKRSVRRQLRRFLPRPVTALLALLLVLAALAGSPGLTLRGGRVTGGGSAGLGADDVPPLGLTHTEHSVDPWGDRKAVASARKLLETQQPILQNQHIMGWGAENPEPAPGVFDFSSLDRRIELIRETGGIPVITLCCAPDWMKGGKPGTTDWSKLEVAPAPSHYDDFAALAKRVAQRYPDVKYYQVWNELKGFFDDRRNRWDYEGYTSLYNQVYDALKSVAPHIQVGGPYVVMDTWSSPEAAPHPSTLRGPWGVVDRRSLDVVEYWLRRKHGADFIALDASIATKDGAGAVDAFVASQKFSTITAWVRQRTSLPLWWSEWYVDPPDVVNPAQQRAIVTAAVIGIVGSGASAALLWGPESERPNCAACLWTSTRTSGGGQAQPFASTLREFNRRFPPGTSFRSVPVQSPDLLALASSTKTVVVNASGDRRAVEMGGEPLALDAYEVRWLDRP
jgi:Glycosyl hydrolases family 39